MTSPLAESTALAGCCVPLEAWTPKAQRLLCPELQELIARVHRELELERAKLLIARQERQECWNLGECPDDLPDDELSEARGDWRIAPLPSDLMHRRVEVSAPSCAADRVVDVLSRNADGVLADAATLDFEDSMKPCWGNVLEGLVNLVGAAEGTLSSHRREIGRELRLDADDRPLILVRPRGLHLEESNVLVDGAAVSAALFDVVCSAYWSARTLLDQARTPTFSVPKCEHHLEARWWNRLLERIEEELDLPSRTIKAIFLVETLSAVFQMEEILYQARDRVAGMSLDCHDMAFSDLKVLCRHPDRILADRATLGFERPWMRNAALRLISVCHRHGGFAIGDMTALGPSQRSAGASGPAPAGAELDFGFAMGHDGCRVASQDLILPALDAYSGDHQPELAPLMLDRAELLPEGCGPRSLSGLRSNVRVGIAGLRAWNEDDLGSVDGPGRPANLATFEIARAQTWQWLHHGTALEDGEPVTLDLVRRIFAEEQTRIERELAEKRAGLHEVESYRRARLDAETIFTEPRLRPFLSMASDPAGLALDLRRARLRRDGAAD
ncbi:MAG TPA: hypothetical protein VMT85_09250 [Thermoanaerobaculia bacterium]|nr:hypothetical protein [Thermoanaerobaculia bacterium]